MALFDFSLFNQRYGTPPISSMPNPPSQPPAPAVPQGMFGAGKPSLTQKLGLAGDVLTGRPIIQQQLQDDENRRYRQAQIEYEATRSNRPVVQSTGNGGFAVINPVTGEVINQQAGVPEPTSIQRNYDWLKGMGGTYADDYLHNQTTAPPLVVPNADGTRTVYPAGAVPRGPSAPPTAPVGKLTPMGGAAPSGPRTFPVR